VLRDLDLTAALATAPPSVAESIRRANIPHEKIPSYKRGGVVRKTGLAKVHKGERVISARAARVLGGAKKTRKPKRRTTTKRRTG
jgi:hypothetical protein